MKKLLLFLFISLFLLSCSSDSESDLQEDDTEMTDNTDDNSDDNTTDTTAEDNFTANVKPIIESKCTPCHVSGGSNTNYTTYSNAVARATTLQDRINREENASGFMPQGGSKLSADELAKFDAWIALLN